MLIISTSIYWMIHFISQIPRVGAILMRYWMSVQGRAIRGSVIYGNKFIMGYMTLRRILMIPCYMFWRVHLRIIRVVSLIIGSRGRLDGRVDVLLLDFVVYTPLSWVWLFPWAYRLNWYMKDWTYFFSLVSRILYLKSLVKVRILFILVVSSSLDYLVIPPSID